MNEGASANETSDASISKPFIQRPIATTLLTIGLLLAGILAFRELPVSALPQVDYPTIVVSTYLPGASAETMASAVTTPLERQFGQVPSLTQMTSISSLGSSQITLQFDLDRNIDAAEQDVQAAINAASALLPRSLPAPPTYSKSNPADTPILTLSVDSPTLPLQQVDDYADSILAQKVSQVAGVGLVTLAGAEKPAVRIQVDPQASRGLRASRSRTSATRSSSRTSTRPRATSTAHGATSRCRDERPAHEGRVVRPDHRRLQERERGAPQQRGAHQGQRGERRARGVVERSARGPRQRAAPAGRQRHRGGRPREDAPSQLAACDAARRAPSRSSPTAPRPSARRWRTSRSRSSSRSAWSSS